ncbi:hypothetical protein ABZY44_28320 [Streptomyces sp. NPDC006544]|uniref:hypothetical protein n=1 Tax=Streptomyces sp. NPDC006544 TaxID=3154583 RepID=UPI0033BC4A29
MGQKTTSAGRTTPEPDREPRKKLDLSAAQVAGSSLATVAAALLASKMGVYGTILGAGVVSVVATAGGPVIQHFFRRTGDQLRESARPKARQVPVRGPQEAPAGERAPDGTMVLREVPLPMSPPPAGLSEEFGEATVHGSRVRGWKRTAAASGLVFALALGGLGTYEAIAGTSVSKGGGTLFSGGTQKAGRDKPAPPGGGTDEKGRGGTDPRNGNSPSPSRPDGGRSSGAPDPGSSPSPEASPGPSPSPSKQDPTPARTPTPPPGSGSATPGGAGAGGGSGTPGGPDSGPGQGSRTP